MRRSSMKGMLILGALVALALGEHGVRAEPGADARREVPLEGIGVAEMMPPPPEELLAHMARRFGLSSEQRAKIRGIFATDREKCAPLLRKMAGYRQQLRAATQAAAFDEAAVRAIAVQQAQTQVELTVSRARVQSQVNALLTPEQRALMAKLPPPFPRGQGRAPGCCCERSPGFPPPPLDDEPPCGPGPGRDEGER